MSKWSRLDFTAQRSQERDRPDWAGGGLASALINGLIQNEFLYGIMYVHSVCKRWDSSHCDWTFKLIRNIRFVHFLHRVQEERS